MEIAIQIILNGIIASAVYALMAMAFNLMYGVSRLFHLALGGFAVVGGYTMLFFLEHTTLPLGLSLLVSMCIAGVFGWLCDIVIFHTLRRRRASTLVQIVASLGLLLTIQALIAIAFSSEYQSFPRSLATGTIEIGGGILAMTQVMMITFALVCLVGILLFLRFTKYGRAVKAVSDDAEVATIIGINTERVIGLVSFSASCLAGLAGALTGFDIGLQPTIGLSLLLKGAIGGVVGGLETISGAALGALGLGLIENLGTWFIASQWKDAIAFAVLIVFLIFRPRGLISKK